MTWRAESTVPTLPSLWSITCSTRTKRARSRAILRMGWPRRPTSSELQKKFGRPECRQIWDETSTGGFEMNRREFLGTTAASAVALAGLNAAIPAFAQAKMALKASDVHPAGYPTVVAVESIGKKLEAATGG